MQGEGNLPEPNSSRLASFKSTCFDNPAYNVGPRPGPLGRAADSRIALDFPPPKLAGSSGGLSNTIIPTTWHYHGEANPRTSHG